MQNCADIGCNTVLWQVRGEGTVAYPSRLEPWSREYDFRHPGFDPLAVAVEAAHRHGLRIEAWINVMPGWKGQEPPPRGLRPAQVHHAHPEWFLHDANGRRQPLGDFYVILNPCLPEVRAHVTAVVEEMLTNYDLDGIHLDYVRYAWDGVPEARDKYPRDSRTLALYRSETGRHPDRDSVGWHHWRANQLTRLVTQIRAAAQRARPGATLTAAVWRDPRRGYRDYLQNSVAWLRSGLVDAVMPMAYTEEVAELEADIDTYRRLAPGRRVVPGLGLYQHDRAGQLEAQLGYCLRTGGSCALFSYASLFPTAADSAAGSRSQDRAERARRMRREATAYRLAR